MDLIQTAATIILMTLLIYFIMLNVIDKTSNGVNAVPTSGKITFGSETEPESKAKAKSKSKSKPESESTPESKPESTPESEQVYAPKSKPQGTITNGLNTDFGFHDRTTVGAPVKGGNENLTTLALFNSEATGIVPSNHDLFEKQADFGSDVTNINQFYTNNPDIFEKSSTYVPDATTWDNMGKELYDAQSQAKHQGPINAANYENGLGQTPLP
jgi:hypothetical protein